MLKLNPKVIGFFGVFLRQFRQWLIGFQCIRLSWSTCFQVFRFKLQVWQWFIRFCPFSRWRQQLKQRLIQHSRCMLLRYFISMCLIIEQLFPKLIHRVILLRQPIERRHRRLGQTWLFLQCWMLFRACSLRLCWFQRSFLIHCRLWPKCLKLHRLSGGRLHNLFLSSWSIQLQIQLS